MIALLKALHITGLALWSAALLALPVLLSFHKYICRDGRVAENYIRFRWLTHVSYTLIATPAAVVTIIAGTALIFALGVYEIWLLAKLALVSLMVLAHAWLGHLTLMAGEKDLHWRMPLPALAFVVILPAILGILWLVLEKPDLSGGEALLPAWALSPLGYDLDDLFQEVLP